MQANRPKVNDPEQPNAPIEPEVPYQPTEPDEPDIQQPITATSINSATTDGGQHLVNNSKHAGKQPKFGPVIEHSDGGNEVLEQSSMHLNIQKADASVPGQPQSITGKDEQFDAKQDPQLGNGLDIISPSSSDGLAVQPGRRGHEISRPNYH